MVVKEVRVVQANRSSRKAERYAEAALDLIRKRGGSTGVTLREVSKRLGFAHTNAYNYFTDFQDLLWAALRIALVDYSVAIIEGMHAELCPAAYVERLFANYVGYGSKDPGAYRFISSDPLDPEQIPDDIIHAVIDLKTFFVDVVAMVCGDAVSRSEVENIASIIISYLDGEALALINGRSLPGEDTASRAVENALQIVERMTAHVHDGITLAQVTPSAVYPVLSIEALIDRMGLAHADTPVQNGGAE